MPKTSGQEWNNRSQGQKIRYNKADISGLEKGQAELKEGQTDHEIRISILESLIGSQSGLFFDPLSDLLRKDI